MQKLSPDKNRTFEYTESIHKKPPLLGTTKKGMIDSVEDILRMQPLIMLGDFYDSNNTEAISQLTSKLYDKDIIFSDLDQTLAPSKYRISEVMAAQLVELLKYKKLVIITGGIFETVIKNVINVLPETTNFSNLVIAPIQGNEVFEYNTQTKEYELVDYVEASVISPEEAAEINHALQMAIKESSIKNDTKNLPFELDEFIQARGSGSIKGISLACLGQTVPRKYSHIKENYDKDKTKRQVIIEVIKQYISPELIAKLDFKIGGSTTIDIVKKGCDKGSGIKNYMKLEKSRDIDFDNRLSNTCMLGDSFGVDGNDKPARDIGVESIHVGNPDICTKFISAMNKYHEKISSKR